MSPAGTIITPIDLIQQCFQISSVFGQGQQPTAADTNRVFIQLNSMIGQWSAQRWLLFHLVDLSVTGTGAQKYSVGIGGDISAPRPDRLESAYVRLLSGSPNQPVDFPLAIIPSYENYSQICLKKLNSFPYAIFYDSGYPLGYIYPWPVPSNQYEIHIIVKAVIDSFATLTTPLSLPPVYIDALLWNLSARIRPLYGQPPDPSIVAFAKTSLNVVRGANTQIATLSFPSDMPGGGGGFDPTSGNFNGLPFGF